MREIAHGCAQVALPDEEATMMAMDSRAAASDASAEHRSIRLPGWLIAIVEDVARGVEEGEAGLKSCAVGALAAAHAGAKPAEVTSLHHREVQEIEDVDDYLNAIGDMLAKGFSFDDAFKTVGLAPGGVQLDALERWCERVGLRCDADCVPESPQASFVWEVTSAIHARRRRARGALAALRSTRAGTTHAAVLHVVYGWPDTFLRTLTPEARSALGEYGPLARYTDTVEGKRQELVRAEAARRERTYVRAAERHAEGSFAAAASHMSESQEAFRLAAHLGVKPTAEVFDLELRRSRLAWADRVISSGDALRAATDRLVTPDKEARERFITQVRIDANRMLSDASQAFLDAWDRS